MLTKTNTKRIGGENNMGLIQSAHEVEGEDHPLRTHKFAKDHRLHEHPLHQHLHEHSELQL